MTKSLKASIDKVTKLLEDKYLGTKYESRLTHILGVANTAKILASKYNISEDRAYLAGLMHDYFRYESKDLMQELLTKEEISECEACPILYHAYASSAYYLKYIGEDKEIAKAIKYHTFGKLPMTKLEEIILISDYIEENRKYENCIYCRDLVNRGLFYTAIYESTRHTIEFNNTRNIIAHPYQIEVLNYYKDVKILELLEIIKESLDKVKAVNVMCYDSRTVSPFYDYIVLATVSSSRQSEAVRSYLEDYIKNTPFKIRGEEGADSSWYLIDLQDVIVSILSKEERERLDLDSLYANLNEVSI